MQKLLLLIAPLILLACSSNPQRPYPDLEKAPSIQGKSDYLASPYVTAGDRLYIAGHQDGSFPAMGWHVPGEMGGVWDHPIKLMDGFGFALVENRDTVCLKGADQFINYPFTNLMRYQDALEGLRVDRIQWIPDGEEAGVIVLKFWNKSHDNRRISLVFKGYSDLRPVWLGERTGMGNGPDSTYYHAATHSIIATDVQQNWYAVWGSVTEPIDHMTGSKICGEQPHGKGSSGTLVYQLELPANGHSQIEFIIAGSQESKKMALETLEKVQQHSQELFAQKTERYHRLHTSAQLDIPDAKLSQAYEWVKYNTDWLIREVPEQGRAISAGIEDYPWWFGCDSEYALQGILATGRRDIVYSTLKLLHDVSESTNGNGRVVHEVSTNGAVFNPGNINETPQFASMVWTAYEWTGDRQLLEDYYPFIQKGLKWLLEEGDHDGNLFPDGAGMMEVRGLESEMIDVAVYTQQAFRDAQFMAQQLNDARQAMEYKTIADSLETLINEKFWVEEFNSYADFIGTAEEALELIEDAIVRADTLEKPWAIAELAATKERISTYPPHTKQGFVLHHNWVVNTPIEAGIAPPERAIKALETGRNFINPFGMFVTGIDRDESAGSDDGSFAQGKKVFSYTGAVMTLPTGVQAIAENNYGRPDIALDYLNRLVNSFSYALPGSMYEVSPDFGMMVQAWNVYALAVPLVQQFIGIRPRAYEQTVQISPLLPSSWGHAEISQLPVGENVVNVRVDRNDQGLKIIATQTKAAWNLEFTFPAGSYQSWKINGEPISPELRGEMEAYTGSGAEIILEVKP